MSRFFDVGLGQERAVKSKGLLNAAGDVDSRGGVWLGEGAVTSRVNDGGLAGCLPPLVAAAPIPAVAMDAKLSSDRCSLLAPWNLALEDTCREGRIKSTVIIRI